MYSNSEDIDLFVIEELGVDAWNRDIDMMASFYENGRWKENHDSLLEAFRDDFKGWTIDKFSCVDPEELCRMESILLAGKIALPDHHSIAGRLGLLLDAGTFTGTIENSKTTELGKNHACENKKSLSAASKNLDNAATISGANSG